jgi:opacity protein-like surface antigen
MKLTAFAAAAAALLFINAAQAQQAGNAPRGYAEIGYSSIRIRDAGISVKPTAVRGIAGYNFHPNFAVEGMAAFGASSDSTFGVDIKVRDMFGVFVKPKVNIDNFELFARLGWARTRLKASFMGVSATDSDSDFAWGVGANYNFTPTVYGSLDYLRFQNGSPRADAWTLGVGFRF